MTYTTASGVVIPSSTDAYAITVDLKTMADKQATWENRVIVADDTARLALTTPELRDGIRAYVTATDKEWVYDGSTWVDTTVADSGYIALTLLNSWVNFGGAYSTARYRKVGGWVELTGLIKSGTTTSSTVIATLPAGFRPATQRMFPAVCSANAFAVLEARANGDITVANVPSSTYLSLEGIRFFAEA